MPLLPHHLLARVVDDAAVVVCVVDVQAADQPTVYVNRRLCAITGYGADELLGRNPRVLQGPDTDRAAVRELALALRAGGEHRTVLRNYRRDGSPWWNELHLSPVRDADQVLTHYVGYQVDSTARVEAEQQLVRQAERDELTGLANRGKLFEHLHRALRSSAHDPAGGVVAVVYLDLDGFKSVNDTHGHAAGDAVLTEVAQRLRQALRRDDVLARAGGDEFVAVLPGLDPLDAERVARRAGEDCEAVLQRPVTSGAVQVRLGASVGVAVSTGAPTTPDRLLAEADAAMYRRKRARSSAT